MITVQKNQRRRRIFCSPGFNSRGLVFSVSFKCIPNPIALFGPITALTVGFFRFLIVLKLSVLFCIPCFGRIVFRSPFVSVHVQRAMQATTKGKEGGTMSMEAFTTSRASDEAGPGNGDDKQDKPGREGDGHPSAVVCRVEGNHHCRQVGQNHDP